MSDHQLAHAVGLNVSAACEEAARFLREGNLAEAERLYTKIAIADPTNVIARHAVGLIRERQNNHTGALQWMESALTAWPDDVPTRIYHANVLSVLNRFAEALGDYERVLKIQPDNVEALFGRAGALHALERPEEALADYDKALSLRPRYVEALNNRGNTLRLLKRSEEALLSYSQALAFQPAFAEALHNTGHILRDLNRNEEALVAYDRALTVRPDYAEALYNRGNLLQVLNRFEEALASYDKALIANPCYVETLINRAGLLRRLKRLDTALESYDRALTIKPDAVTALYNRGMMQWEDLHCHELAIRDFEKVAEIDPDFDFIGGKLLHLRLFCADWRNFDSQVEQLDHGVRAGKRVATPFQYQPVSASPADLQKCSAIFARHLFPAQPPLWKKRPRTRGKIRLGYVSGEFRGQATAHLTAGLYEAHDRGRFELVAIDSGWDDGSFLRKRLEAAFDKFVMIDRFSDRAAAEAVLKEDIDILINLNGYFGLQRMGVFAHRPAPIQVNYLGFPATLGASYMDYILADRIVIPENELQFYSEQVVYLPDSYQANDSRRAIADNIPTRADCGLPPKAFVFCNFNAGYKLTPSTFAGWMRILKQTEGSVLWLLGGNGQFSQNLRSQAQRQGVDGARILFAPVLPVDAHLARLTLADLFLDGLPYNAHTTASDALWAGVPLVTCPGTAFPGRVAASLLAAIGLPELVTRSLDDYESLAVKLAHDSALHSSLRRKLAHNRLTTPLFDTARFTRNLELAFARMWDIHMRGDGPRRFSIEG